MEHAMEGLVQLATLTGRSTALAAALVKCGWTTSRLATLQGMDEEVLLAVMRQVKELHVVTALELKELIMEADKSAKLAWRLEGSRGSSELMAVWLKQKSRMGHVQLHDMLDRERARVVPPPGAAKLAKWELAEESERARWLKALACGLFKAGAPVALDFGNSEELAKSKRTWERYMVWLHGAYGLMWPVQPSHFVGYLEGASKLFKLWGGMRLNDTQGIEVSSMKLTAKGLVADITQSKTTGPGKAVARISVCVARGAWLVEKHWLQSGFSLWLEMAEKAGLEERDYFLALPTKDLGGIVNRVARYTEAVGMTQAICSELGDLKGEKLLHEGAGALWTEHSERATARSWAAVAGIDAEVKKKLGRWKASVDEDYERTTRTQVEQAQRKMAAFVKVNKGRVHPAEDREQDGSFKPHVESDAESSSKRAKLADDMVSVVIDGSDEATSWVDSSGGEKAYPPRVAREGRAYG
ncbi:unnamed protein product [Effrenium voratum]|uniref:Uncharacterized protein n=1 Tax=Effrenium voratum TaxID=2562239 RepID=A0AA36IVL8_9DINO|nr:unnamed protein product [Effrenium voratum]